MVGNKAFGFTPTQIMELPWFTFMTMLIDFNVMSERPSSGVKSEVKRGSGGDLAKFMGG